jgi:hypothetical protein
MRKILKSEKEVVVREENCIVRILIICVLGLIKEDEMVGAYNTRGRETKCLQNFGQSE